MSRALPLFRAVQVKIDRINQVMRETLSGVRVIRAFVRTRHEEARFDVASRDLFDTSLQVNRLFAVTIPTMTAIFNLSTVAVIWFGAMRVEDGAMPIGNLTAFLQYLAQILFAVLTAVFMFILIPRGAVSAGRIREVLDTEPIDPRARASRSARATRLAAARSSSTTSSSAIRAPRSRSCARSRSGRGPARPRRSSAAPAAASRR